MEEVKKEDVDNLCRSMLNYYFLVQVGAIHDPQVGQQFLDVVKEIAKRGTSIFENY